MTQDKTYNGWANYETWCVALWLENEEGTYRYWRETARELAARAGRKRGPHLTRAEQARVWLADRMREEIERDDVVPPASLYADLLNAALGEVEWAEVADAFLADFIEGADEEAV